MKEIVIKLTDHCYKRVVDYKENLPVQILEAIRHGVVLSKGHSRLFDEKDLYKHLNKESDDNFVLRVDAIIDKIKPIIEADKN